MFLGHFAVAFAAKRAVPSVSLGVLFAGAQLADLVWPNLALAGIEKVEVSPGITAVTPLDFVHYPWSHGLGPLVLWGALFAAVYLVAVRGGSDRGRIATMLALVVVSHWLLDFVAHRPDMPIGPGSERRYGLELWQSRPWTVVVELALLAIGTLVYLRATRARDRKGTAGLAVLLTLLVVIFLASAFGPPPPSATAVLLTAELLWLFVFFGAWIDRHRSPV